MLIVQSASVTAIVRGFDASSSRALLSRIIPKILEPRICADWPPVFVGFVTQRKCPVQSHEEFACCW